MATRRLALGVDVASVRWRDNGTAVIEFEREEIVAVSSGVIDWPSIPLSPRALAHVIDTFARAHGIDAVALDGPQGWRDPATEPSLPGVGRRCEYACRTQGKTGVYPQTYPGNQRAWIEFSIKLFDWLLAGPAVALAEPGKSEIPSGGYLLVECFPTSTWRTSGLAPLPAKRRRPALTDWVARLSAAFSLPSFVCDSHDDLQAVVGGLAAMAVGGGPAVAIPHGVAANLDEAGRRLEGFIWDAAPATTFIA